MTLFTIGFTKKSAQRFFATLKDAGVRRLIDIRLNNSSQLAGFAKKADLKFFVKELCGIEYDHLLQLAPTKDLLDRYRKGHCGWSAYEHEFLQLIESRRIEETTDRELIDGSCLLCTEETAEHCHRRLVAEYLNKKWGKIDIIHL